ncbi:hypothetical protein D3C80_1975120 [compost metagenome]
MTLGTLDNRWSSFGDTAFGKDWATASSSTSLVAASQTVMDTPSAVHDFLLCFLKVNKLLAAISLSVAVSAATHASSSD